MTITFDIGGSNYDTTDILSLDLRLTDGSPCDSFEVTLPGTTQLREAAAKCTSVTFSHRGSPLLRAFVDDFDIVRSSHGARIVICGRGSASTLMSEQCKAATFDAATISDIIPRYAKAYQSTMICDTAAFKTVRGFDVTSGQSAWQALRDFCAYSGNICPRFDPLGRLVLNNKPGGLRIIDDNQPVTSSRINIRRSGFNQVLLNERTTASSKTVRDDVLTRFGFSGSRTIAVPRGATYDYLCRADALLWNERRERRSLEISLAMPFAALPRDIIDLRLNAFPYSLWMVGEARCSLDGGHAVSTLICYTKD